MYRKNPGKETTYRSPKGSENYIITKRRHLKYIKDAEANDKIHVCSDHRCVTATFTITTPKRDGHRKIKKGKIDTTKHEGRDQIEKHIGGEQTVLEKRYQEIIGEFSRKSRSRKQRTEKTKKRAAVQAKSENAEAEAEEADGEFSEIKVRNDVEAAGRTWEGHPGHRTQ